MTDVNFTVLPLSQIPRRPSVGRSQSCYTIGIHDMKPQIFASHTLPLGDFPSDNGDIKRRPSLLSRMLSFKGIPGRTRTSSPPLSPPSPNSPKMLPELFDTQSDTSSTSDSRPITPPDFQPTEASGSSENITPVQSGVRAGGEIGHRSLCRGDCYNTPLHAVCSPLDLQEAVLGDANTVTLLNILAGGAPTFSPRACLPRNASVLDLGTGTDFWATHAEQTLTKGAVKKLNLLSVVRKAANLESPGRPPCSEIYFRRCTPFRDSTFDLVHLTNWELVVSSDKIDALLYEIMRILKPGGRVEIVCDIPIFPYCIKTGSFLQFDEDEDPPSKPGLSSESDGDSARRRSASTSRSSHHRSLSPTWSDSDASCSATNYSHTVGDMTDEKQENLIVLRNLAENIEDSFGEMLRRYRLDVDPSRPMLEALNRLFPGRASTLKDVEVVAGKADNRASNRPHETSSHAKRLASPLPHRRTSQRKEARSPELPSSSVQPSAKARAMLGISAPQSNSNTASNSFVPCSTEQLRAYACKHIDNVISCESALWRYAQDSWLNDDREPLAHWYDEMKLLDGWTSIEAARQDFDDIMSQYTEFKVPRMDCLDACSGLQMRNAASSSQRTDGLLVEKTRRVIRRFKVLQVIKPGLEARGDNETRVIDTSTHKFLRSSH